MPSPINEFFLRLGEILLAAILAGAIILVWNGVTTGQWESVFVLFIVPLSLIWGILLSALTVRELSMGFFLLLTVGTVIAVYLVARYLPNRWLRLAAHTALFVAQQFLMALLVASNGIAG